MPCCVDPDVYRSMHPYSVRAAELEIPVRSPEDCLTSILEKDRISQA